MSGRHKEKRRERRSRSRSVSEERRNQSKRDRHERRRSSSRERYKDAVRFEKRRHRTSRESGKERRVVHGSPERKRRKQNENHLRNERNKGSRSGQEYREQHNNADANHEERQNAVKEAFLGSSGDNSSQTKEKPNFELSGKLTEYTNTYKGVVIKYNEPPEALKPKTRWRLYPFKGDKAMPVLYIHRQSAYLIGRQRHIVDLAIDHPSCSKQHAVLQYRLVNYEREDGTAGRKCKPYVIDLESANGTFLNNQKIEARRYYELKEKDVLKFGFSTREYVLLNEKSKTSVADEDDISEGMDS